MGRASHRSDSLLQAIRRYFGLDQNELAMWLGITQPQLSRYEAGARALPQPLDEALQPWQQHLPAAPLRVPALGPPERAPLEARLDYCQHHARRLRRALARLEEPAIVARRWQVTVPALRAALPPDPGPAAEPDSTADGPAWRNWFRHRWLDRRPTALPADLSARHHLLRLQAEALETEAAALQALLPSAVD